MKVTRELRNDCPSGIDCDRIYDTDGDDFAIQGRTVTDPISTPVVGTPTGTAVVLIARSMLPDADLVDLGAEEISSAGADDLAIRGRTVNDPTTLGISTPPHESVVLVSRALLTNLATVPAAG